MGYINTDQCDCCKEIWNRINLHHIPLQSKTLIMCDDCLSEFNRCFVNVHKIDKAIEKIDFLRQHEAKYITENNKICIDSEEVLKILKNIGE